MMARRVTLTPAEFREHQIREALDGTFVAMHFTGRMIPIEVPKDFNPFSAAGRKIIEKAIAQKVVTA